MESKLLRCPFCNKRPILEKFPVPLEECYSGYLWTIVSGCGVQMHGYGDKDATINKWNTRVDNSDKLRKVLKEVIMEFNSALKTSYWQHYSDGLARKKAVIEKAETTLGE